MSPHRVRPHTACALTRACPYHGSFLSILEKQFARSDLYLFELLQNAVDEGARHVAVELTRSPPGLRFAHDGKGFSPLDVNGLASVGMSTKATKRAVGFMGIGFKACHKRFAHVICVDKEWRCVTPADRSEDLSTRTYQRCCLEPEADACVAKWLVVARFDHGLL